MQYYKSIIEALLEEGRVGLGNALNTPEIVILLDEFNFGQVKLQQGEALRLELQDRHTGQIRAYAQQQESTAALSTAWDAARKLYKRHTKMAEAVLDEHPELLLRLGLKGRKPQAFGAWLARARQFYREALADEVLQTLWTEGGLALTVLEAGEAALDAADQADREQESAKGLAQQATQDRDIAAAAFEKWMKRFWKIVEVALADHPQWLERLGRKA